MRPSVPDVSVAAWIGAAVQCARARARAQQFHVRWGDDDGLGLAPGTQLRHVGSVRGAERQPGRVHRRAYRRPEFCLARLQTIYLERPDSRPVAD